MEVSIVKNDLYMFEYEIEVITNESSGYKNKIWRIRILIKEGHRYRYDNERV